MPETKEITATKKKQNLPAASEEFGATWGAENIDATQIVIPKILCMQGLSQMVADGEAQMGDIVDSLTGEMLGCGREKDFQDFNFVPIYSFQEWIVYEKLGSDKLQFIEKVPYNASNANWQWDTDTQKRVLVMNFYVMLEKDLEEPGALPYLLSFRSTSYKTGKKLSTFILKGSMANRPAPAYTYTLSANKDSNDKGTFYVFDVKKTGETDGKHYDPKKNGVCFEWFKQLKAGQHKVDDSDIEVPAEAMPTTEDTEY
jgi:hypothetical protein